MPLTISWQPWPHFTIQEVPDTKIQLVRFQHISELLQTSGTSYRAAANNHNKSMETFFALPSNASSKSLKEDRVGIHDSGEARYHRRHE